MATGTDKFMNYNGLVKLIGLIKKLAQSVAKTVKYNRKSENAYIPVVTGMGASITDGSINEVGYNEVLSFNPSSNTLRVKNGNTSVEISPDTVDIGDSHGKALSIANSYIEFYDENGDLESTLRANTYGGHANGTEFDLKATGSGKGADMVKYDTNTTYASGSVGAAITALQGAVGGGDLVKQINTATQESQISGSINYNPNTVRTGNYTKANGDPATFTYYETTYDVATPDTGSGQAIVAGKTGLMSSADKTKLDNLNSSTVLLSSNITVDGTSKGNVQDALTALNTLAAANKSAISTLQSSGLTREVVTALPTGSNIKTNVIYMILASNDTLDGGDPSTSATTTPYGTNNNSYNEYMYINNAWERIGSTEVNLDIDPITDDEIDTAWSTTVAAA